MADFHEVQFPPDIAYGAVGGPEYRTTVVVTASGREQRNSAWAQARGRWRLRHPGPPDRARRGQDPSDGCVSPIMCGSGVAKRASAYPVDSAAYNIW